jgi:dephospho-CoA kinase
MKIIGLTGGIASGKNLVSDFFVKNGAIIFDADEEVHNLLENDENVISQIKEKFPDSFINGKINRRLLGMIAIQHSNQLEVLENIIHPKVRENYQKFLEKAKENNVNFVVLNVPLLLETNSYETDAIIGVIANENIRKERFLKREELKNPENFKNIKKDLEEKFKNFISNQISDFERIKKANFVIENEGSIKDLEELTQEIIDELLVDNKS